jgi:Flp pilus assembly protein TadD
VGDEVKIIAAALFLLACAPPLATTGAPQSAASPAGAPNDAELRARAHAAGEHRSWAEAEADYAELERRHPDDPEFKFGRGIALMKLGHVDEAIVELERGRAIKDSANAEYNLAIAHGMKG